MQRMVSENNTGSNFPVIKIVCMLATVFSMDSTANELLKKIYDDAKLECAPERARSFAQCTAYMTVDKSKVRQIKVTKKYILEIKRVKTEYETCQKDVQSKYVECARKFIRKEFKEAKEQKMIKHALMERERKKEAQRKKNELIAKKKKQQEAKIKEAST